MSIREYDVGARNIHHDPSLRTAHIDVPSSNSYPVKDTGEAGPIQDMYGQTEFHMSPSTHFDYSMEHEEPEIASMEIMDIQVYGESSMKRQQECDPKVSQTSTSFNVDTEPTEFEYSVEGSGNRSEPSEGKKDKVDAAGGEGKEHLNHVGAYPESNKNLTDKIIEYGLKKGMKFPAIKELIEAMSEEPKDKEEDKEDKESEKESNMSKKDESFVEYYRIIQEGLTLGLSNSDILSIMEAIDAPLDEAGKKKWIQKAVNKMERKGTEGSLTKAAHKAGESPMEFARAHKHSKGKVGKKARFALNVNKKK